MKSPVFKDQSIAILIIITVKKLYLFLKDFCCNLEDESDKKEEEEEEDDEIEDSLMHMKMNLTRRHSIGKKSSSWLPSIDLFFP